MKLENQVALIIGSGRGIGETIAHTFSQEGASVVLVDLEKMKPQLDGVAQAINRQGGKATAITADCSDDRQVNSLADEKTSCDRDSDNVIGGRPNEIATIGTTIMLTEYIRAAMHQATYELLPDGEGYYGEIAVLPGVFTDGSVRTYTGGREGMALRGSLCAAKWGLVGLTQTIAKEAGPYGIRANVICPGGMDEPDLREMYAERAKGLGMEFSQLEQQVLELTPLRKYAKHDEVAKAALFLASSDSSHTTGESLNVSGGRLMS